MAKKSVKYHCERDSPFFRLRSRRKLASLLFSSLEKLDHLAQSDDLYFDFEKQKDNGGVRRISAPRDDLKTVQTRIAQLLQRIAPPDYLFAPVAGRSYVGNAARHVGAHSLRLLDIEDFFPSCTANKVIWFFTKRMECSLDVAIILKGIVTKDGALPQGSPCSPILAYLCYLDMWEVIEKIVADSGCCLSVYADDLTISGAAIPENMVWKIKQTMVRHGHRYNADKERSKHLKPTEITGVILVGDKLLAPNRQHQKLHFVRKELNTAKSSERRTALQAKVRGRVAQLQQIIGGNSKAT
jgi:retron-type reverse transcriptase